LENLLSEILTLLREGVGLSAWTWAFLLLVAALGSLVGSYLKTRGQNLATKQDIGEITKAVETIKTSFAKELESVKA
jgi:uncharacterized membrane protein